MAEDESKQPTQDIPAIVDEARRTEEVSPPPNASQSPLEAHAASDSGGDPLPLAGAAFVGGFLLAKVLKRIGGGD
jgi:hypothetical protein